MYEKIKLWYSKGLWSADMVANAVAKGIITAEQYESIVGEPYAPPVPTPTLEDRVETLEENVDDIISGVTE